MAAMRRGQSLLAIGIIEYATPLIRILVLSRLLDLRELGFCSALLSTYGVFEQMSDLALYRFVIATPPADYEEALACAHALSLLRGIFVGAFAVALSPLVATVFGLSQDQHAFMFLGVVIFARSFENFAPRVAEREFRFSAQLKGVLIANALSLLVLIAVAMVVRDHRALLASLFVLLAGYAAASHIFADARYRIRFRSPLFAKAFRFGFPLTINGLGLALSSQADRFLVGGLLGLPALGVYTVISTAVILPTNLVWRILGGVNTSLLYRAAQNGLDKIRPLALAANISAIVAAAAGVCVALLLTSIVPMVFGPRFHVSGGAAALLAFVAYFRIVRGEPFSSILLLEGRTKRLALVNFLSAAGLLFSLVLMSYSPTLESAFAGRLAGEILGLGAALYLTRNLIRDVTGRLAFSYFFGFATTAASSSLANSGWIEESVRGNLVAMAVFGLILIIWSSLTLGPILKSRLAHPSGNQTTAP